MVDSLEHDPDKSFRGMWLRGRPPYHADDEGRTRDLLRAVVTMSPLPMVLTDPHQEDSPVVFCNASFTRLTGYSEKEVLGKNCRFLQGPDTDPASIKILSAAVRDNAETQVDLWNYRRDGSRFWNTMFVGPVFGEDGDLLYHFGSQIDATAKREVDEARARALRIDTLGSMSAGIAHEVRNLMTVVAGNAEGLKSRLADARQLERLGRIEWAAQETEKLTSQMLSFASRKNEAPVAIDLNAVLRDVDHLLSQASASKTSVTLKLHEEALIARLDVSQLELALINLVRNASDACAAGACIEVASSRCNFDGRNFVEVRVTDDGTGMPPDVARRAAEPFFTTKSPDKGTGLGLSMVSGFCAQFDGRMLIETAPGKGTTIRLIFPTADFDAGHVQGDAAVPGDTPSV